MTPAPVPTDRPAPPWEVREAARHLKVSERTLRARIAAGTVRVFRVASRVLISAAEMDRIEREGC